MSRLSHPNLLNKLLLALCATAISASASAATIDLADAPIGATVVVPANVILDLSVEFPTGDDASYLGSYVPATEYVGYFNPGWCYSYTTASPYFVPQNTASTHTCSGKWSGNFLNWALTQTIDPMRKALTGGYRSVDTATTTVLQKAFSDSNANNSGFPNKTLSSSATISGATPFSWSSLTISNRNAGLQFYFSSDLPQGTGNGAPAAATFTVTAYPGDSSAASATTVGPTTLVNAPTCYVAAAGTSCIELQTQTVTTTTGSAIQTTKTITTTCTTIKKTVTPHTCTATSGPTTVTTTTTLAYELYGAAQVCGADASSDLETSIPAGRCRKYGSNYKPIGLIQQYAAETTLQNDSIRYAAFGYLNDSNILRDGGVMRAKMKSVGPLSFNPGQLPATNPAAEWDATTGVFSVNPDSADAATSGVTNSGVVNYLNKFGLSGSYKTYDDVGELYYAATRYYRNLGNVASYTSGATTAMLDTFPAITTWDDPIKYSCSKNYIIGVGDIHTHADANLPGRTYATSKEPAMPAEVTADLTSSTGVNAVTATNWIATLENQVSGSAGGGTNDYQLATGIGNNAIDAIASPTGGWCCNSHSFLMAGLAYDVHTRDIRPDITSKKAPINVSTFWVDVFENADYHEKNQFWLTAKYGGFDTDPTFATDITDPKSWPAAGLEYTMTTPPTQSWWNTGGYTDNHNNLAPDQYFQAESPAKMQAGFKGAFDKIHANAPKGNSSSLALATKNVKVAGDSNYAATFDKDYSGDLIGSSLAFNASTGAVTPTLKWHARDWLPNTVLPVATGVTEQTADGRRIATSSAVGAGKGVAFRQASLSSSEASTLDLSGSSNTTTETNVVNYIRGDQCNEKLPAGTALTAPCSGTSAGFRPRTYTLGDITNSKPFAVGKPSMPYADAPLNPGYNAFITANASRQKMVYVGANDGMMHAFDGTTDGTTATGGKEMFAYVPSFLFNTTKDSAGNYIGLASLAINPLQHHFMVDTTPVVTDVDFARSGASGVAAGTASDWRSILISGLGKGGKGYFALDVTNPLPASETALAKNVLWEVSPSHMGYSYGEATVVKTAKWGWTVVVTSGYNNDDGKGYFYLLNPKDGSVLDTVPTNTGSLATPAGLTFVSAFVEDNADFTADALYAGDLLGNVWRVDLTTTSGLSATKIATLADKNSKAQPVTTRPVIAVDPATGTRYVFVGTGRLLADTDLVTSDQQTFYAFIDGKLAAFDSTISTPLTRSDLADDSGTTDLTGVDLTGKKGFFIDLAVNAASAGLLASAERINVQPTATTGAVAFAANLIGQDVCSSGSSRVFALNFNSDNGAIGSTLLLDSSGNSVGSLSNVNPNGNPPAGVITDLSFVSIGGNLQLYSGDSSGLINQFKLKLSSGSLFKKLNWREVPSSN